VKHLLLALSALGILLATPVYAQTPDYLTFGGGVFDFDKHVSSRESGDYRLEYQWGTSLIPMISDTFDQTDSWFQLHPTLGFEGNSYDTFYANGGLNLDIPILWRHSVLTWGEALGFYGCGDDPRSLGSNLEFRSQLELGWRFDSDIRMSAYISHLSNAHIANSNPGAEIVGAYLRLPLWWENGE